jgi:hypothetical protein
MHYCSSILLKQIETFFNLLRHFKRGPAKTTVTRTSHFSFRVLSAASLFVAIVGFTLVSRARDLELGVFKFADPLWVESH